MLSSFWNETVIGWIQNFETYYPFKDKVYMFYIRTQYVPRCKHSPLRL
jgi:hypothetical protein